MRLTPADVHNVAFKKPSLGKRGYDEDEVDAFLDLVEAELSRFIEENNELTQRLATAQAAGFAGDGPLESASVGAERDLTDDGTPPHVQAARLLGLAQETADKLTAEARADAANMRASAKAESDKLLSDATAEANRLVTDAQGKSDAMVLDATTKAEALEEDSRTRAEAMDREAQEKYSQAMTQLTEQRAALEKKIDDLRIYEREYRSRLKSWISEHLAQLDESGAAVTAEPQTVSQGAEQVVRRRPGNHRRAIRKNDARPR
jgi:DivIVA domain-containing protein